MKQKLYDYFLSELSYLRSDIQKFSDKYPNSASSLHLNDGKNEDPHISCLIEAFALLNSRTLCQNDFNLNKLSNSLLEMLFPHYAAPLPSCSIVQLTPPTSVKQVQTIPRGDKLETLKSGPFMFTTCYESQVLPVRVTHAKLNLERDAVEINFSTLDKSVLMKTLNIKKLRLYINGQQSHPALLYEYLTSHLSSTIFMSEDTVLWSDGPDCIQKVGAQEDEALYPWPRISSPSSRLLYEYYNFRKKFFFIDINLTQECSCIESNEFSICFQLNKAIPIGFSSLDNTSFLLNCLPVINLVEKRLDPITIHNATEDIYIKPSTTDNDTEAIHTVTEVKDITDPKNPIIIPRIYSAEHKNFDCTAWVSHRKNSSSTDALKDDVYLSLTLNRNSSTDKRILDVKATCFNHNLVDQIKLDNGNQQLQFVSNAYQVESVQFIGTPSTAYTHSHAIHDYEPFTKAIFDNQLTFSNEDDIVRKINNALSICDLSSDSNSKLVESVLDISCSQILKRSSQSLLSPFCYGSKITITLNEKYTTENSLSLLKLILTSSFTTCSPINTLIEWEFILVAYND